MGTRLTTIVSSSGKEYDIMLGNDGVTYCKCPAWRFSKERPRTCKHLEGYMSGQVKQVPQPQVTQSEDPVYDDG